jgi:hypothetical protein
MDAVYIPTLSRIDTLRKTVPQWLEQELQVWLVIDRTEFAAHSNLRREMGWGSNIHIILLPLSGRGIGYARNFIVQHARKMELISIIMSDDEFFVHPDSNACELLEEAEKPEVLGIGATRSLHDRFTGGAISKMNGPILCPGGWGFQLFGLNIQRALDVGNFDRRLHTFGEDAELARQGIKHGTPWLVHCDVKCVSINKREAPGGISSKYNSPEARLTAEKECQDIIHKMWPEYTNPVGKKPRVAWQKLLDNYIPDWKESSAIHGGSLDNLGR